MPIKNWPSSEQPRIKLINKGPEFLSDAELLALFFGTGVKGKSAVDLARETLQYFGSLRALLHANFNEIRGRPGLGLAKFASLQAALELGKRYLHEHLLHENLLSNSKDTKRYLCLRLRDYPHEVFVCLFLNTQNQLLAYEEISHGSIRSAEVYPRKIVKQALQHNASSVIVAHNHPSGKATPSETDYSLTSLLKQALALIEVNLLDHFIVGEEEIISMAELGAL